MDVKLKIISCKKIKIKNKTAKHLLKKQQQQSHHAPRGRVLDLAIATP